LGTDLPWIPRTRSLLQERPSQPIDAQRAAVARLGRSVPSSTDVKVGANRLAHASASGRQDSISPAKALDFVRLGP
jgi:hypothetical protein